MQRMPGLSLPIVVIFDNVGPGGPSVLLRMILGTDGGRRLDCLYDCFWSEDHGCSWPADHWTCSRLWDCGVVLAGVKAKPCGWPAASLNPQLRATPSKGGSREQAGGCKNKRFGGMFVGGL